MTSLRIAYYTIRTNLNLWRRSWFAQILTGCVLYAAFQILTVPVLVHWMVPR